MTAPAEAPIAKSGGGRPTIYKAKDGKRVPGCTTIASKYKEPGALMHWAHQLGLEGKDFRGARDEAAGVGHIAHAYMEDSVLGRPLRDAKLVAPDVTDEMRERAQNAFQAFLSWRESMALQPVAVEWPLVSELHRFGGTLDLLALVNGKPALVDYKTAGGIYAETIAQLAGYRQLVRESVRDRSEAPADAYALRFGRELGDWHCHYFPSEVLDIGWERFQASKWMADCDAKLKGVLR